LNDSTHLHHTPWRRSGLAARGARAASERGIPIRRGRGRHEVEQFHVRFCFPMPPVLMAVLIGVLLTLFYRRSAALWPVVLGHCLTDIVDFAL
jgi:membrane protease YdiL (CAAX protease family)